MLYTFIAKQQLTKCFIKKKLMILTKFILDFKTAMFKKRKTF